MPDRAALIPGPQHPITIAPHPGRVAVSLGDSILAETRHALVLREASYPAVFYIPREDAEMAQLRRSDHRSWCPYKGEAAYFDILALGGRAANAVWTYEAPFDAVAAIAGHLAFYPDRVTIETGD